MSPPSRTSYAFASVVHCRQAGPGGRVVSQNRARVASGNVHPQRSISNMRSPISDMFDFSRRGRLPLPSRSVSVSATYVALHVTPATSPAVRRLVLGLAPVPKVLGAGM